MTDAENLAQAQLQNLSLLWVSLGAGLLLFRACSCVGAECHWRHDRELGWGSDSSGDLNGLPGVGLITHVLHPRGELRKDAATDNTPLCCTMAPTL